MRRIALPLRMAGMFLGCSLLLCGLTGCQSTVGGQTLPSPDYLTDDIQYFPAGPENKLHNQMQAIEQYNLERQGLGPSGGTP